MSQSLSFSILLPVHWDRNKQTHGDFYYASSLAKSLKRLGHSVKIFAQEHWDQTQPDDIALVIRGRAAPQKPYGRLTLEWCISFPPKRPAGDFMHVDHFFAASPFLKQSIARFVPADRVSILYQAFDADVMFADDTECHDDLVFVGTPRSEDRRPVVSYAAQSGCPTRIWGGGWEDTLFAALQAGHHVNNADLGHVYRSGRVVLNDHLVIMKRNEIISNRVYDGLACGRAVLTDTNAGLPPDLVPWVYTYADADSFKASAQKALAEDEVLRQERAAFAQSMKQTHSFDQRAQQICDVIDGRAD